MDVLETEDALILYADLPGVKPDDVALTCKGDELVLHAACEPRHAGKRPIYAEYGVGDFHPRSRSPSRSRPAGLRRPSRTVC